MKPTQKGYLRVAGAIVRWWTVLTVVAIASLYLSSGGLTILRSWWGFVDAAISRAWLVLPFVTFAGGLAASPPLPRRREAAVAVVIPTLVLVGLTYFGGAVLSPLAEFKADERAGVDLATRYPLGPQVPSVLADQRTLILQSGTDQYRFSIDHPLERPPNWLTYLIHQPVALAAFGVLNALLGLLVGWATTGLSPPHRRHARWAFGLAAGVAFFVAASLGGEWVRNSPPNSGVLGAWLPLTMPLLGLFLAYLVLRARQGPDLHAGRGSRV